MRDSGNADGIERAVPVITVVVAGPLCRRGVRLVSQRVSDVPGVVTLQVDAAGGRLRIRGDVDVQQVLAALRSAGFAPTTEPPAAVADG